MSALNGATPIITLLITDLLSPLGLEVPSLFRYFGTHVSLYGYMDP